MYYGIYSIYTVSIEHNFLRIYVLLLKKNYPLLENKKSSSIFIH